MPEETTLGAEVQEVAEPVMESEDTGAEVQEAAEPAVDESKSKADAAFAELRRQLEAEQKRARELEAANKEYESALSNWFPNDEDKALAAQAYYTGRPQEEIAAEREAAVASELLRTENERLKDELNNYKVDQLMAQGLKDIQAIDPSVKDLTELGDSFANYISKGLTSTQAYFAVKAEQAATKPVAPKAPGRVNQQAAVKEYYTQEEVEAMSAAEVHKNYDAIRKSMQKW